MCGIIGYVGDKKAVEILVNGLKRLEYRGYDSCGIAVVDKFKLYLKRVSGRVEALSQLVSKEPSNGMAGIAHTRWATHGVPSEDNAHPHTDCSENLVVVHNGIIENYLDIKEKLVRSGHKFKSETDTEVIVHLLEEKIKALHVSEKSVRADLLEPVFFEAFRKTANDLKGSFAMGVVWLRCPDMILGARMHSPLVVGLGKNENFLASDVSAFLKFSRKV
ncbi:MAG: class II glutamine amidotransferase, partial [Nitrospirae bacterium]|nr:class II glutamine amidotransferase [Nitrospirota bacterium]